MYSPKLGTRFTQEPADDEIEYTVTDTPGFGATEDDTVTLEDEDGNIRTEFLDHFSGRKPLWEKVADAPENHSEACDCERPIVDYDARVDGDWCDCGEDGGHYHCKRCGGVR